MPETTLLLENVSRGYGARRVLRALSLSADGGETVSIVGANGSGKSTLLKVVAGLLRPSGGSITLRTGGQAITQSAERRTRVALATPDVMFYPELSSRENLEFFGKMRGQSGEVAPYLQRVGLKGREDDPVGAYSSGMRQRLRLAFAWMGIGNQMPLLLLDEPSLALDENGVTLIAEMIAEQKQQGGVTLLATNDCIEAGLGDRRIALGR